MEHEAEEIKKGLLNTINEDEDFFSFVFWCLLYGIRKMEGVDEEIDKEAFEIYKRIRSKLIGMGIQ